VSTPVALTTFPAPYRWASVGHRVPSAWKRLVRQAHKPQLWPSEPTLQESEDRLAGVCTSLLRDDSRVLGSGGVVAVDETQERVEQVTGILVEYVDEPLADETHLRRWWKGRQFLAWTTAFHQRPYRDRPPGPRWRVLLPFAQPLSLEQAVQVATWLRHPHNDVGSVDASTLDPSRVVALPAIAPGGYAFVEGTGERLDLDAIRADLTTWEHEDRAQRASRDTAGASLQEAVSGFRQRIADPGRRTLLPWPGGDATMPDALEAGTPPAPDLEAVGKLAGSLWPGRLAVLIGPSGSGRTALALQMAEAVASTGHPVLYASAGLPTDELVARLLVIRAHGASPELPASHAYVLEGQADPAVLDRACDELLEACPHLYLWTPTTGQRTDEVLRVRAAGVAEASGGRPPLIVVDPVEGFEDGQDLNGVIRELSAACRDLVRAGSLSPSWPGAAVLTVLGVPAQAADTFATDDELAAQTADESRRAALRHRLTLGLGGLGADAALLLALARGASPPEGPTATTLAVIKNRHGHAGCVRLAFHGAAGIHDRDLDALADAPA